MSRQLLTASEGPLASATPPSRRPDNSPPSPRPPAGWRFLLSACAAGGRGGEGNGKDTRPRIRMILVVTPDALRARMRIHTHQRLC